MYITIIKIWQATNSTPKSSTKSCWHAHFGPFSAKLFHQTVYVYYRGKVIRYQNYINYWDLLGPSLLDVFLYPRLTILSRRYNCIVLYCIRAITLSPSPLNFRNFYVQQATTKLKLSKKKHKKSTNGYQNNSLTLRIAKME